VSKHLANANLVSSYDVSYFRKFSETRLRAISLCAEMGLPLYKIHHSIVIGDAAMLIANEVERQMGVRVDYEIVEAGALLHDVGISQIISDDMPEHAYIGGRIAQDAGFGEKVSRCIELHDCAGFVKEYVLALDLPRTVAKDDLLPETWEEKIVAYADMIISLEGEWQMDVWNDDTCPARAYFDYISTPLRIRRGLTMSKSHPQFEYDIEFNRSMRRFVPRAKYETLLRPRIDRMVKSIRASGMQVPFPSLAQWP